ncbi:DedA family protein [Streptomyces sp. NPDC060030]|uniref:DedA family protein n=1 Tax=Streptomyces sp. NPDC060030 TaxID=3347042 RepID=UPI003690DB48
MHLTYAAPLQEPAGGIAGWAAGLVEAMGGPGAGLAIALENLFPPLPSEVILPLTGFAAGQGVISLASALFWTTLGSVTGAVVLYWIGMVFGRERMHTLWGKLPLVKASDLVRTEEWFAKHGTKAVLLGRMVPIFRSLVSVPAGVERPESSPSSSPVSFSGRSCCGHAPGPGRSAFSWSEPEGSRDSTGCGGPSSSATGSRTTTSPATGRSSTTWRSAAVPGCCAVR